MSDWSSDVVSSDLPAGGSGGGGQPRRTAHRRARRPSMRGFCSFGMKRLAAPSRTPSSASALRSALVSASICAASGLPSLVGSTIPDGLKRVLGRLGYIVWGLWSLFRFRPFEVILTYKDGRSQRFQVGRAH